jgi:hypothetical protein
MKKICGLDCVQGPDLRHFREFHRAKLGEESKKKNRTRKG